MGCKLTNWPQNPVQCSVRLQDAVRRDQAGRVGTYTEYRPEPCAGE